jgi:IPT/TIG domain
VGRSVALSADGNTALLGGPGYAGYVGAAWMFTRTGSTWIQRVKLTGAEESGIGHFGRSTVLSADGSTALVGGLTDNVGRGAAWAFTRTGSSFTQQGAKLVGGEEGGEPHFGASLALSGDGNFALIGAPRDDGGYGTVTQYVRSGSTWSALPVQLAGTQGIGRGSAGTSVALSVDGQVALVGAMRDNSRLGAAWVFADEPLATSPPPTVTNVTPTSGPTGGGTEVTIRGTNFTGADKGKVLFGSIPATGVKVVSAIMIKARSPAGPEGTVDVTVSTPTGTSAISPDDTFTFVSGTKNVKSPRGSSTGSGGAAGDPAASGGVLGFTGSASSRCTVSLSRNRLVVQRFRVALLRLVRTGTGACKGKVTLRYKVKVKRKGSGSHFKLRTIGNAGFSISPGKSQVVKLILNKAGQSLFRGGRGKLNASLALVRVTPQPMLGRTASVRLSVKKTPRSTALKR